MKLPSIFNNKYFLSFVYFRNFKLTNILLSKKMYVYSFIYYFLLRARLNKSLAILIVTLPLPCFLIVTPYRLIKCFIYKYRYLYKRV